MKLLFENWRKYLKESSIEEDMARYVEEIDPLAISILGAPAAGKSYTKDLIGKLAARFQQASDSGTNLTVDAIRDEFLKAPASERLPEFFKAFYSLKDFSQQNPNFAKWFSDIQKLWNGKLSNLILQATGVQYTADDNDILASDQKSNLQNFMTTIRGKEEEIASKLHYYHDHKRVVRHLQLSQSAAAAIQKQDVTYDEVGDEPEKMVDRITRLHKMGYLTDTILVHPSSVIVNLLQNAGRMIVGQDGGRDSSSAIVDAYNAIDAGKEIYSDEAEVTVKTSSDKLPTDDRVRDELAKQSVADDAEKGDKPIDVFVQVDTQSVKKTYERIKGDFSPSAQEVLHALLVLQVNDSSLGVDADTKRELAAGITNLPSTDEARKIIMSVKNSDNPKAEYGQTMMGVMKYEIPI
jgi:hypothetical protein